MKKVLLMVGLLAASPCFAFDFGSIVDKVTDSVTNKIEDKVVGAAEDTTDSVLGDKKEAATNTQSKREALKELKELKEDGLINASEYAAEKKRILAGK